MPFARPGHSGTSCGAGWMILQLAKLVVRDHRNSPSLLVRPIVPDAAANQATYPATGSSPAASAAPARRQPDRRTSR